MEIERGFQKKGVFIFWISSVSTTWTYITFFTLWKKHKGRCSLGGLFTFISRYRAAITQTIFDGSLEVVCGCLRQFRETNYSCDGQSCNRDEIWKEFLFCVNSKTPEISGLCEFFGRCFAVVENCFADRTLRTSAQDVHAALSVTRTSPGQSFCKDSGRYIQLEPVNTRTTTYNYLLLLRNLFPPASVSSIHPSGRIRRARRFHQASEAILSQRKKFLYYPAHFFQKPEYFWRNILSREKCAVRSTIGMALTALENRFTNIETEREIVMVMRPASTFGRAAGAHHSGIAWWYSR